MIYVAAPFWHESENIRKARRQAAILYSERLFFKGKHFYSPLLYSERFQDKKQKENFWLSHGLKMVDACTAMHVLCLDGWEQSSGIKGEVERANELEIQVQYIQFHSRVSFHGSRALSKEQCLPIIKDVVERCQVETIVTHGEPHGACEYVRKYAQEEAISLKLHFLQKHRLAGMFHWRSTVVLEDAEKAIFLHDNISDGTANELKLCKKMGLAYEYYGLENNVLVLKETEESEKEDLQADTGFDKYEKKIDKVTRGSKEYQAFRKAVLKRDNNKCVFCGSESDLCVHHIVPFSKSNNLAIEVSNGQTLCEKCHAGVHGKKVFK